MRINSQIGFWGRVLCRPASKLVHKLFAELAIDASGYLGRLMNSTVAILAYTDRCVYAGGIQSRVPLGSPCDIRSRFGLGCVTALNSIDANSWKGIEMAVKDMSEGKDQFPDNHQQDISPDVMDMLTAQVQRMVDESGNPAGFDARSWLSDWLRTPVPALDNRLPIEYLGNAEGVDLISRILASAQTGAYW